MAHWEAVRLASTTNIDLRSRTRSINIDGKLLSVRDLFLLDRVLLKDQTRENENGIYLITRSILPPRLRFTRTDALEHQMIVRVTDGDMNANTTWRLAHISPPTFLPQEWDGDWKAHVRAATAGHVSLIERVVDSVTLEVGDRVLVRAQFNDRENGIYVIPAVGHRWERANDMRIKDDYNGVIVYVSEGEVNANTLWVGASTGVLWPGEGSLIFHPFFSPIASSALIVRRIEELRGISGEIGAVIKVLGANEPGDGGEGDFSWTPSGSDSAPQYDDGGIKIRGHGGWWQRLEAGTKPVNVKWFGAKGDGIADDRAAIQKAINFAYHKRKSIGKSSVAETYSYVRDVYFPAGTYSIGRAQESYGEIGFYHGLEVYGFLHLSGESGGDGVVIKQHESVAPRKTITEASFSTPVVVTCTDHGFINGQIIEQRGVNQNTNANGRFEVRNKTRDTYQIFYLNGKPVEGNGVYSDDFPTVISGISLPAIAFDSGIALIAFQHYKNRFSHIQFQGGRHALRGYGYAVRYGLPLGSRDFAEGATGEKLLLGSRFNPVGTGSRIVDCSFLDQNGYSVWLDMTPMTNPELVRATQDLSILQCKHVGANYIWWFSDHLEVGGGSFYIDQTQFQALDVRRHDACFAEIGNPDGLPLPYIHNPNNTYVHHIMCLPNVVTGRDTQGKPIGMPSMRNGTLFGPGNITISNLECFDTASVIMRTKSSGNAYAGAGAEAGVPLGCGAICRGYLHLHNAFMNCVGMNSIEVYHDFPTEIIIQLAHGLNSTLSNGIWVHEDSYGSRMIEQVSYNGHRSRSFAKPGEPTRVVYHRQLRLTVRNHHLSNGDVIDIYNVEGITLANCCAKVMVIDEHTVDLYREWGLPVEEIIETDSAEVPSLPGYIPGSGRICKSGHVDLMYSGLRQQIPVYSAGLTSPADRTGFMIVDQSVARTEGMTGQIRYGGSPQVDPYSLGSGLFISERADPNRKGRDFSEIATHSRPRNNLFLPGQFGILNPDELMTTHSRQTTLAEPYIRGEVRGSSWSRFTDLSKGYQLEGFRLSGGTGVGVMQLKTALWPADGVELTAGLYTFLWEAKTNHAGTWMFRWIDGQQIIGGLIREYGPTGEAYVQYAVSFWYPGGTTRYIFAIDSFNVPDRGSIVAGCWMIVEGRALAGVPYTMPVDNAQFPALNTVSQDQPNIYFAPLRPSGGTYLRGDIVYNTNPYEGDPVGWVCISDDFSSNPSFADFGQVSPQGGFLMRNWLTVSVGDQRSGGLIDPSILQVDQFNAVRINQTTIGQRLVLPEPTIPAVGKMFAVINVGTQAFQLLEALVEPRTTLLLFWDGTAWSRVI
ncbi:MAG: glycosyl hydrolase family 28-related protein [Cyanobacteriota bacterium]